MNREQRRREQFGKTQQPTIQDTQKQVTTQYGHNGDKVILSWNQKIEALMLTEDQVDSMIGFLQKSKQMLHDHKVANGTQPS